MQKCWERWTTCGNLSPWKFSWNRSKTISENQTKGAPPLEEVKNFAALHVRPDNKHDSQKYLPPTSHSLSASGFFHGYSCLSPVNQSQKRVHYDNCFCRLSHIVGALAFWFWGQNKIGKTLSLYFQTGYRLFSPEVRLMARCVLFK